MSNDCKRRRAALATDGTLGVDTESDDLCRCFAPANLPRGYLR
jgi:hypothetical protein